MAKKKLRAFPLGRKKKEKNPISTAALKKGRKVVKKKIASVSPKAQQKIKKSNKYGGA